MLMITHTTIQYTVLSQEEVRVGGHYLLTMDSTHSESCLHAALALLVLDIDQGEVGHPNEQGEEGATIAQEGPCTEIHPSYYYCTRRMIIFRYLALEVRGCAQTNQI